MLDKNYRPIPENNYKNKTQNISYRFIPEKFIKKEIRKSRIKKV